MTTRFLVKIKTSKNSLKILEKERENSIHGFKENCFIVSLHKFQALTVRANKQYQNSLTLNVNNNGIISKLSVT